MKSGHLPVTFGSAAALLSGLVACCVSWAALAHESLIYASVGLWALCIVLIPPALMRSYDWFSCWTFVILTVVLGVTARGCYMSMDWPNSEFIDEMYLLGKEPSYFFWPGVILLAGLLLMGVGYVAPHRITRKPPSWTWRIRRIYPIAFFLLVLSAVSTFYYIRLTGGLESGLLSAKRTVIPDLNLEGAGYKSYGELRFLASLAIFGHLMVLADVLRGGSRGRIWKTALALALLLLACVVPFYASIRSNVGIYLCLSGALCYYAGGRVSRIVLSGGVIAAIGLIYTMTVLRAERSDADAWAKLEVGSEAVESLILNRNQIELAKTAHIIHALPDRLQYQWGGTILRWLAAPIPRSLWPNKPVIHPGPIIGRTIYDQPVAGVPPGLVAELYWNFALPGVLIGCFGFGWFLRKVYEWSRPERGGDPFWAALYVAGPMLLGYEAVGSSLGSGIFRTVFHLVAMGGLLWLIRGSRVTSKP